MRVTRPAPDRAQPSEAAGAAPVEVVVLSAVAVVVGMALRFVANTPLWLDEALSANIAALPIDQIMPALEHDGHPPLYYFLLHGWMQVFGTADTSVRALSGVLSLAALPLAYLAGRRRGGPVLGWVLLGMLGLSPYALRYATETRMYALVVLLVLVGYLLLDDVLRLGRGGWRYPALGATAGFLMLSHYWSMWLLGAVGLLLVWLAWRRRPDPVARRAGVVLAWLVGGVVVLFGWWLPTMLYQAAHTGTPWAAPFRPTVTTSIALIDLAAGAGSLAEAPVLAIVGACLLVLGLLGRGVDATRVELDLRTNPQVRYEAVVLAGTIVLGILAGYASASAFASRYAAVIFPLYLLIAAAGVTRFLSRPVRAGVLAGVLTLSMVGSLYGAFVQQRSQSRELAEAILAESSPGDVVVYCPDQLGPSTSRELAAQRADGLVQVTYPLLTPPERVDWVDYSDRHEQADPATAAAAIDALAGPDNGIFVVWAGTYRTLDEQCEELVGELGALRPRVSFLVGDQGDKYFEHANLNWFPAEET